MGKTWRQDTQGSSNRKIDHARKRKKQLRKLKKTRRLLADKNGDR